MEQIMVPICSPHPSPSSASAKVSCQEATHFEKQMFDEILSTVLKKLKTTPCQGVQQFQKNTCLMEIRHSHKKLKYPVRGFQTFVKKENVLDVFPSFVFKR